MISLEQVLLLEQKVESAVEKIQQLEAENDALRNKCSELTNALSAKSEQLKAYESDQQKIESGIIKAIDRLNSIENSVLKGAGTTAAAATVAAPAAAKKPEPVQQAPAKTEPAPAPEAPVEPQMNFDSMDTVEEVAEEAVDEDLPPTEPDFVEEPVDEPVEDAGEEGDGESTDNLGFDIF
ncbi:MAG: cell division protein ZapB [Spirochaetaceae bacterium]|nr:cell division protein ZapB [Spirochaetaceae bacterium]